MVLSSDGTPSKETCTLHACMYTIHLYICKCYTGNVRYNIEVFMGKNIQWLKFTQVFILVSL